MDTVYIVLRNSIDWSGPPPTFAGVGGSVREALESAGLKPDHIDSWMRESSLEERAYYTVVAYDMNVSPPKKLERWDLIRGGGPVRGEI